jgi:hypothetical protein
MPTRIWNSREIEFRYGAFRPADPIGDSTRDSIIVPSQIAAIRCYAKRPSGALSVAD